MLGYDILLKLPNPIKLGTSMYKHIRARIGPEVFPMQHVGCLLLYFLF